MEIKQSDIEDYIKMKHAYDIEYEVGDVETVFYAGGFSTYPTDFLDYLFLVIMNTSKYGKATMYGTNIKNKLRRDKVALQLGVGGYHKRVQELIDVIVPLHATELATLTLEGYTEATTVCEWNLKGLHFILEDVVEGLEELQVKNDETLEMLMGYYFEELSRIGGNLTKEDKESAKIVAICIKNNTYGRIDISQKISEKLN